MSRESYDAVIVGSGPNGLAAAILLASAGLSTLVLERASEVGGGTRSSELTVPGFLHDVCSTVHPLAFASPFFARLPLERLGCSPVHSPAALAHVLDADDVATLEGSVADTAATLGPDGKAYRRLFEPLVSEFAELMLDTLGPLRWPRRPLAFARFGTTALRSLAGLARRFEGPRARALLAGVAAHAMRPLDEAATASFALVLATAGHAVGWPVTRGGSRSIAGALSAHLRELGGTIRCNHEVSDFRELPEARAYLFDVTPRQLLAIAGHELPSGYRRRLERFHYGTAVFKCDWALREPIPWRNPACARAATVHLSGTLEQVAESEACTQRRAISEHPFVIVVQPTLFDPSRVTGGGHVGWAYAHVPNGATADMTAAIEGEIERYAPGFRDTILARATRSPRELEDYNPNYVGGDINGGSAEWSQLFFRPTVSLDPYATPNPRIFLCSSSTPPGGGVHGMCGYFAAQRALRQVFERRPPPELDLEV